MSTWRILENSKTISVYGFGTQNKQYNCLMMQNYLPPWFLIRDVLAHTRSCNCSALKSKGAFFMDKENA